MNSKISFFINTKKVEADNNETIWDVSKKEGIDLGEPKKLPQRAGEAPKKYGIIQPHFCTFLIRPK